MGQNYFQYIYTMQEQNHNQILLLPFTHYEIQAYEHVQKNEKLELHDGAVNYATLILTGTNNHLQSNLENYDLNTVNILGKRVQSLSQVLDTLNSIKTLGYKKEITSNHQSNISEAIGTVINHCHELYNINEKQFDNYSEDEKSQRITKQLFPALVLANYLLLYFDEDYSN
jgi:regulator of PEP synthase PpsR (kinase-PPPase family)